MAELERAPFSSAAPLFAFDEELRIVCWNEAAAALTGIPGADAVGRRCWEVIAGEDDDGGLVCHPGCARARRVRRGERPHAAVVNARTPGGRRRIAIETIAVRNDGATVYLNVMGDAPTAARAAAVPLAARPRLTPRQGEILRLLAEGQPVKTVARRLGLMETTVRNHIRLLFLALGVHSQLEAVARARAFGLL